MTRPKVLVANPVYGTREVPFWEPLRQAGFEVVFNDLHRRLSESELIERLPGVIGTVAGSEPYNDRVFASSPDLKVVARFGVGYDSVDVEAATRHGVAVAMAFGTNHEAVADYAFAHIMAQATSFLHHHAVVSRGTWAGGLQLGLWRRTIGIIGFGRIGKAVARRARGFECRNLATDIAPDRDAAGRLGVELTTLDDLLTRSDIVTIHTPKTKATTGLIGARELGMMKPTSYIVCTARGGIIDENALVVALSQKRIAGAGLDVFAQEPLEQGSKLRGLDNITLSPHCAGLDLSSERLVAERCVASILAVHRGRDPGPGLVLNPSVLHR